MASTWPRTPDNRGMEFFKRLTPRTVGIASAVITIAIWTSFIVVAQDAYCESEGYVALDFHVAA